jgi:hypothetical protein
MKGAVIGIGALAMLAGFGWLLLWSTAEPVRGSDGEAITLAIVAGLLGLIGVAIIWLASVIL